MPDIAVEFIDYLGAVHSLTQDGVVETEFGVSGRFMPRFTRTEEQIPHENGSLLRAVTADPREVAIPISYLGTSDSDLRTLLRSWAGWLNPLRGDGVLRVTGPDGTVRILSCRYAGGLELVEGTEQLASWQRAVLVFRAVDPFWYDNVDTITPYTTGAAATFFPFFPLRLSSSTIFGAVTVTNGGDVEAWPVWLVTGPGSALVLRNLTTNVLIDLPITLAAGESLTIDTRPGYKTVIKQDGTNLFGSLTTASTLWSLMPGSNSLRIEFSGATSASAVQLSYRRRFLTP